MWGVYKVKYTIDDFKRLSYDGALRKISKDFLGSYLIGPEPKMIVEVANEVYYLICDTQLFKYDAAFGGSIGAAEFFAKYFMDIWMDLKSKDIYNLGSDFDALTQTDRTLSLVLGSICRDRILGTVVDSGKFDESDEFTSDVFNYLCANL